MRAVEQTCNKKDLKMGMEIMAIIDLIILIASLTVTVGSVAMLLNGAPVKRVWLWYVFWSFFFMSIWLFARFAQSGASPDHWNYSGGLMGLLESEMVQSLTDERQYYGYLGMLSTAITIGLGWWINKIRQRGNYWKGKSILYWHGARP